MPDLNSQSRLPGASGPEPLAIRDEARKSLPSEMGIHSARWGGPQDRVTESAGRRPDADRWFEPRVALASHSRKPNASSEVWMKVTR